ncbi:Ribosomal protein S8e domain containing protein [Lactarius tabidus]
MPRNEYIEEHIKRHGRRLDYYERKRKREARLVHRQSAVAQKAFGLKAKLLHAKRHSEKVQLKKTLKAHDERNVKQKDSSNLPDGALPTFLLDREGQKDAKALSTAIKQKRKDKAAKYAVPLPKVRGIAEDEMFKVMRTGKSKKKSWKRMVTKATFVGEGFTRKPVKMERFVRPMALRYKKANVTHPDLKATFQLQILGVKKNPQSPMYTQLGVLTKGTVIEVNVSELGMVTAGGKVVFGKYAQITNNPENDGCINAVLRTSTRHARNALEKQRQQLERLLKDPAKPAAIPAPPKEKTIRPPREMMKNVQGSSAGAGSGEFHVYKASRRLEYERLKAISDGAQKESVSREFEDKKRQREQEADAKTAKNRARRQKKKERAKGSKSADQGVGGGGQATGASDEQVLKKRRVVNGKALVFRRPGEESDGEDEDEDHDNEDEAGPQPAQVEDEQESTSTLSVPVAKAPTIMIHEDD